MTWNWILLVLLIPALFVENAGRTAGGGPRILGAILLLSVVVPLIFNNVLGPTCAVYFRTAVQIEEVPSLSRMRRSRKTIERLRPLIASVQETMGPDEMSLRILAMQSGKPVSIEVQIEPDPNRIEI